MHPADFDVADLRGIKIGVPQEQLQENPDPDVSRAAQHAVAARHWVWCTAHCIRYTVRRTRRTRRLVGCDGDGQAKLNRVGCDTACREGCAAVNGLTVIAPQIASGKGK